MDSRKKSSHNVIVMSMMTVGVFLLTKFLPGDAIWPVLAPLVGGALFEYLREITS